MKKDIQEQGVLINDNSNKEQGPVTCLGITFPNDAERRAYFTEELRKKLPELKKLEGFPIGEDEDILALSDPPYYTACPNPWIADFVAQWEKEKPAKPEGYEYHREPFAADVSEGKNDPIYNAHSYHTKVPHKAIMRYILHYTEPGDIVFDGFCGTGMTGVAAQMCGNRDAVAELGYQIREDGTILKEVNTQEGKKQWIPFSMLGTRHAVLNDLSPVASFIAYNYNAPVNVNDFKIEATKILQEVEAECGWMYETRHKDGQVGRINYVVWSDVFVCPECSREVVFWEVAVSDGKVNETFSCSHCKATLTKRNMERSWTMKYDSVLKETIRQAKQVPVSINYSVAGKKFEKTLDHEDLNCLQKIENSEIPYWYPCQRMMAGKETRRNDAIGLTHVHHFYTKRNLWILSAIRSRCKSATTLLWFNSQLINISKLNRYRPGVSFPYNPLSGTYYIGSQISEASVLIAYKNKLNKLIDAFKRIESPSLVSTKSMTDKSQLSVDYIFLDPPFGANLNYSELSSLWEQWLRICTNNEMEAIENSVQGKGINEYRQLLTECMKEAYRVLKPGRWMTVEFSNTQSAVWNSIQTALSEAGFIIANVSVLDKQQGSFKAVTTTTAVKQDLVISAYKPSDEMRESIKDQYNDSVWSFVRGHLEQLPVFIGRKGYADLIVERTPRILFDRMVSYYVQNGLDVPFSSIEFQEGVAQRFPMRDGMVFLESQVAEYDKKRIVAKDFVAMNLFVSDENSAIEWLRQQLLNKPQTRQDLHPNYMREIQHIAKYELLPELDVLLEQNFLQYDGSGPVPSQIHTYLSTNYKDMRELDKENAALQSKAKSRWYVPDPNKQSDLDKLREKSLLKEFAAYVEEISRSKKKLKQFRLEAIRAGFKKAWGEKDFKTIVDIGSKLPEAVLQEDDKLLMYYDNAQIRMGV